jgi:hypothetical protein
MSRHYKTTELHAHPELDRLLPAQSPDEYDAMKDDIAANRIFTPLVICRDGDGFVVIDGRHRLRAATELNLPEVPCTLLDGLDEDARIERGVRLNNRRNMNPEQKRALASALLKRWPDRPDRQLAVIIGCSHPTVAAIRAELVASGDVVKVSTRTDTLGRHQPASKPPRTGSIASRKPPAPVVTNGNGRSKLSGDLSPEEIAHRGTEKEARGATTNEVADDFGIHPETYRNIKTVVALAEDEHLPDEAMTAARSAMESVRNGGSITAAYEAVKPIADAKFGTGRTLGGLDRRFQIRIDAVSRAMIALTNTCAALQQVDVPLGIPEDKQREWLAELDDAMGHVRAFRNRIKES